MEHAPEWRYHFIDVKSPDPKFYVQRADSNGHQFAAFPTALSFFSYNNVIDPPHRNFFESVQGDLPQKPRFDLDIKTKDLGDLTTDRMIVNELLAAIIDYMAIHDITIRIDRDIRIYSSHGPDKKSYHIVLISWYHRNHIEARSFYNIIINNIPEYHRIFIDHGVYSKFQQFRLLGSTKHGADRHKTLVREWKYSGEIITWAKKSPDTEYLESLLTHVDVETSSPFPISVNENAGGSGDDANRVLDDDSLRNALTLIPNYYKYDRSNGRYHRLERIKAGECIVCKRAHGGDGNGKGDNGYLDVKNDAIYLHCFRNPRLARLIAVRSKSSSFYKAEDAVCQPMPAAIQQEVASDDEMYKALKSIPTIRVSRTDELIW